LNRTNDFYEGIQMKPDDHFEVLKKKYQSIDNYFRFMGVVINELGIGLSRGELAIQKPGFDGPPGFIHAGVIVSLADSCAGAGCEANLPTGAVGFTTVELKTNLLGSAGEGKLLCEANATHMGRSTQVWDAVVMHEGSGRKLALFRCTQMILYPK
jgi:1,4-dihydroxy-2-naphthoyl-CoA hydrolase